MWREITHTIPGPGRVVADFGDTVIHTDHPADGDREGRAPEPWLLFLASIGTCMASFVAYCREQGLPAEEIRLVQRQEVDEVSNLVTGFEVTIEVPDGFPGEHRQGLVDAAGACTVKQVIEAGPRFEVAVVEK